ncbi:cell division protein FtsQ/DivIB, partial [Salmonella enterica subsp. enterica serovar Kentucky]|nr:cell division protein FtsQ/DivIB [Salmonella enterica subsp. enterica serovar Kentucky]
LFNSKKIQQYRQKEDIQLIIDGVLQQENLVEQWLPKASVKHKINLGRGDTMKRLARFVELYPVLQQQAQTDGKRISYVDLRYDSG